MADYRLLISQMRRKTMFFYALLAVSLLQNIDVVHSYGYGNAFQKISWHDNDEWGEDFRVVHLPSRMKAVEEDRVSAIVRSRRSTDSQSSAGSGDSKPDTTVVSLQDSHTTLVMHWAGEGSDIIIALAKSSSERSSNIFISENYGKTFINRASLMTVNSTTPAIIHKYYNTKLFKTHYVFSDIKHNCIFTTTDVQNFVKNCNLRFKPRILSINPENYNFLLGMDDESAMKELYFSSDFGRTWKSIYDNVKTFRWGVPPYDDATRHIYVHKTVGEKGQVLKLSMQANGKFSITLLAGDVVDFHIKASYMYVTKSVNLLGSQYNPHKQLWVSHERGDLRKAEFPFDSNMIPHDYFVVDASEGQLMVCVSFNSQPSNLYISEVKGYRFSLSLERVVYFNPKSSDRSSWMRFYTNETFADVTRVGGISGVYIASQQLNDTLEVDMQHTLISFDKGGVWRAIPKPKNSEVTLVEGCDERSGRSSDFKLTSCSLHLTQEFHHLYPGAQTMPILSQESAPGLIMASGTVGKSLKSNPDVFMSTDAGLSWKTVLLGNYLYSLGDHGGVLVAVEQFVPVNQVLYSVDEGETWQAYTFIRDKIRVYGLLTEPGERTTIFSVFGSHTDHHSWLIIQLNFLAVFKGKSCMPEDYKWWSIEKDPKDRSWCLLGHTKKYQRRLAHVLCYNGQDFVREEQTKNCSCTFQDYECDLGFKKSLWSQTCRAIEGVDASQVHPVPSPCPPGTFYPYTRGYRKVSGDTCQGGLEHKYGPLLYSCPYFDRDDFLLITSTDKILSFNLRDRKVVTLMRDSDITLATFDYRDNCIIYIQRTSVIKKLCLNSSADEDRSEQVIKHFEHQLDCLAFDWTGRTLFVCDHEAHTITALNMDGTLERKLYTASNRLVQPRSLTVDPHHGYFYFVDKIPNTLSHGIFRLVMDGSDAKPTLLVNASFVAPSTSLALNIETEEMFWLTPSKRKLYSADMNGKNITMIDTLGSLSLATDLEMYKNEFIILDTAMNMIRANEVNHLSPFWTFITPHIDSDMIAIQVVSSTSQHATSACSDFHNKCSQLCLPRPNHYPDPTSDHQNRTCLCGEGFQRQKLTQNSRDESCQCEQGERLNGSVCMKASNGAGTSCANDKLTCRNGRCILLTWKCDGDDDCDDNTDELDCPLTACSDSTFTCANGKCIPLRWKCDREDDCKDGHATDEKTCEMERCDPDQFRCANGYCIRQTWVCDGDNDCNDMSDEKNCTTTASNDTAVVCRMWEFACGDGTCVSLDFRCDGRQECPDGKDELGCTNSTCGYNMYQCQSRECIPVTWRCDNYTDCQDNSDERGCNYTSDITPTSAPPTSCSPLAFQCDNGNCVNYILVCNRINDCGDNSDEFGCGDYFTPTPTPPSPMATAMPCDDSDHYQCPGVGGVHRCIPRSWLCDQVPDCPRGEDEEHCSTGNECGTNQFACQIDGNCIPQSKVCDNRTDCPDNSDEWDCKSTTGQGSNTCQGEEFSCGDAAKTCVPFTAVCDGSDDCPNANDENANCSVCDKKKRLSYSLRAGPKCISVRHCPAVVWEESHNTSLTWFWTGLSNVTVAYRPLNVPNEQRQIFKNVSADPKKGNKVTLQGLLPATVYKFVFLEGRGSRLCPAGSLEKSTGEGVPSAPQNFHVQAKVMSSNDVNFVLLWDKPQIPRGKILSYHVYRQEVDKDQKALTDVMVQEYQAYSLATNNSWGYDKHFDSAYALELPLPDHSKSNHTYQFWVAASTSFGLGHITKKWTVDWSHAQHEVDLNLGAKAINQTAVALTWKVDPAATSYLIVGQTSGAQNRLTTTVAKDKTAALVNGLCPGWSAMFSIQAAYKAAKGTKYFSKRVVLKGQYPLIEKVKIERTRPTSVYVTIVPRQKYERYHVYYSHHGISSDGQTLYNPESLVTTETKFEIQGLQACERYFLGVVPVYKTCPLQMLQSFVTMEDDEAPPKDLRYHLQKDSGAYVVHLTWRASCYDLPHPLKYIITMKNATGQLSQFVPANETKAVDLMYDVRHLRFGQTYIFTVRADIPAARDSPAVVVKIPRAKGPKDLRVDYQDKKQRLVKLTWLWDKAKHTDFKEYIVTTRGRYDPFKSVNHTRLNQLTLALPADGDYKFTVVAMSTQDEVIGMSYTLEFDFYTPKTVPHSDDSPAMSQTNMVAIMVPVGVVVVLLSAGLVFFIVRHRRLQRSFLAFANSHYNIQSGTTTFSEDLDGDEPMIQGFADDEPLVIA